MVKKTLTIEATVCDLCGKQIFVPGKYTKCLICDIDVCDECNISSNLAYNAVRFALCPNHNDVTIEKLLKMLELYHRL